jgi:signal transduction histidine kinase
VIITNDDGGLSVRNVKGISQEQASKDVSQPDGIIRQVMKSGRFEIITDLSSPVPVRKDVKSQVVIPISVKDKVIGVLDLESRHRGNFKRFRKSLGILANQIAIAIENAGLYEEIKGFNTRLRIEVEEQTRELRDKNLELKKMDRMKDDFVSNVSHELRTPLTSISGYARLMSLEKIGPVNESQKQSLGIILEEADRLTRLINNILDLAKLESGKLRFTVDLIDINKIAESVVQKLEQQAAEKGIKLTIAKTIMPEFKASRDLITQVFMNLLNNALKFTPNGGTVHIDIRRKLATVEVSVKDSGQGIAPDQIPKLFSKFFQVDSSMTRQHGGTGLGLVIVKHIIDAHRGEIKVHSDPGKGSEFIFSLPLRD